MTALFAILAAVLMGALLAPLARQAKAPALRPVPVAVHPPGSAQRRLPRR